MKVVYTAPNRSHHYKYAYALNDAGCLHAFVSGFPRLSSHANDKKLGGKIHRADFLQTLYLASMKGKLPAKISTWLAYVSKIEQDLACRKFVKDCDIFLFYSGSGLHSTRYGKKRGVICIVEAVNTHVEFQENILRQEHKNLSLPWKPFPKNEKNRRLKEYNEADYILLPSEFVKKSFISMGFPEEKLLKIPYGFGKNFSTYSNAYFKRDSFTVLFVGSICVRKGIRYLIEAFKKLQHPQKKLVIVGPDINDGALKGMALISEVIFTGVLKNKELEEAYKSADIFCLPSIEEGLALVLGEALSFGLPIIATSNSGADDIIIDGNEGYIVSTRDSEAIWRKLQVLADTPELLGQLRFNSFAKSDKLNGWEEAGKNLVDTLKNLQPPK